jgi:hypothetical protein
MKDLFIKSIKFKNYIAKFIVLKEMLIMSNIKILFDHSNFHFMINSSFIVNLSF